MKFAVVLLVLTGCGSTCAADSLSSGAAEATVDGSAWASSIASGTRSGDTSVQLQLGSDGTWTINIVAQTTTDGASVGDAIELGDYPFEVGLGGGGTGFASVYPTEGGPSFTSNGESGSLIVDELLDGEIYACFAFDATGDDGTIEIRGGMVRAPLGEL